MIYIVALGVGFKCPRKIHLNTQWGGRGQKMAKFCPRSCWMPPTLCVQMDFTRTFQANAKCNNINHVWSQFYKILVVLKYHRRPLINIFDTDICRSINIPKKGQIYHFNVGFYASKNVYVKDIGSRASMVLQNYQKLIEITWNMIYIVALGGGFKYPRKIHLNTQCTEVRFASWLSGGFTTMAVINPPERKLANAPLCSGGEGTKICQNWWWIVVKN